MTGGPGAPASVSDAPDTQSKFNAGGGLSPAGSAPGRQCGLMGGASTEARTAGARAITRRVLRVLHWGAARPIDVLHVPNRRPAKVVRLRALWLRVLHALRVLRVRPLRLLRPLEFERQGRGDVPYDVPSIDIGACCVDVFDAACDGCDW